MFDISLSNYGVFNKCTMLFMFDKMCSVQKHFYSHCVLIFRKVASTEIPLHFMSLDCFHLSYLESYDFFILFFSGIYFIVFIFRPKHARNFQAEFIHILAISMLFNRSLFWYNSCKYCAVVASSF